MSKALRFKIDTDLTKLDRKYSAKSLQRINDDLGEQVISDMFPFVPKAQTKRLSKGTWNRGRKTAEYRTPYARAQFYGFVGRHGSRVRKYSTPGTSRRWDLRAKARHSKKWASQVGKALS